MFEKISRVPGDAILGLIDAYRQDTNPNKVDLGVGVYRDSSGHTPILESVKAAEARLLKSETTKTYIGSHGAPEYTHAVLELVFGKDSPVLKDNRASATQSPGGTGALRLAADFIHVNLPGRAIWLSDPTWPNHIGIFEAAGINIHRYTYVNEDNRLDFNGMLASLEHAKEGDVVLLHACCHNPTGFDLTNDQWQTLLKLVQRKKLLPLIDFAYQGFGDGLEEDAYGVRLFAETLDELIVTSSCSKNFGIYRERTGAFILVAKDEEQMENVRSQAAITARENYSNPPAHGGAVVAEILNDPALKAQWIDEVNAMRDRIATLRKNFVDAFEPHGLKERFNFIQDQRGMFSYTGLTPEQVEQLRDDFGIYMVSSGRANIAGLNTDQLAYVAEAFANVIKG
ncbi:Aspartate aminotransferase [Halomonadaceae bacterium LMG 33818]|uniref:amino acid aminotransferase n=1 Tax=Cernens ardua TaxID=3402176 RepID=UPI003EDBD968